MKSKKRKDLITKIISVVLVVATLIGVVAVIGHFAKNNAEDDGLIKVSPSYKIGELNSEGKYVETQKSIYTKESFECQGLVVESEFDSTVTYNIYFYDSNGNYISSTGKQEGNYNKAIPSAASHCRIVITPNEDDKISWYEINGYAKQLTVKVSKDQSPITMVAFFDNLQSSFDFEEASSFNLTAASFVYEDVTLYERSTIKKIGAPVVSVKDYTKDNTFTVYVIAVDKINVNEYISKYDLKIKANTFSSNSVKQWYYFEDLDIRVGKGETLAFCSSSDSVIFGYYTKPCDYSKSLGFQAYVLNDGRENLVESSKSLFFDVYKSI